MKRLDSERNHGRRGALRVVVAAAIVGALALCAYAGGQSRRGARASRGAVAAAAAPQGGVALNAIKGRAKTGRSARNGPSANVGQDIRLNGTGFDDNVAVEFTAFANSTFTIRPLEVRNRRVDVKVPAEVITGNVRLVDPDTGSSNTLTLQIVPTIGSFSPEVVAPGGRLLIDGAGFSRDTMVLFNGVETPVAPTIVSPSRIDILVPAGARSGRVTIITAGGRSKPERLRIETASASD